jgi:hypothetical protein
VGVDRRIVSSDLPWPHIGRGNFTAVLTGFRALGGATIREPSGGFSSLGLSHMFDHLCSGVVRRESAAAARRVQPVSLILAAVTALTTLRLL